MMMKILFLPAVAFYWIGLPMLIAFANGATAFGAVVIVCVWWLVVGTIALRYLKMRDRAWEGGRPSSTRQYRVVSTVDGRLIRMVDLRPGQIEYLAEDEELQPRS